MKKKTFAPFALFVALCILLATSLPCRAEAWKEEFDRLCGQTEIAGSLSNEELSQLVADCDTLLKKLEDVTASNKKVYVFRLKKCRNFFQYSLDLRNR